MVNSNKGKFFFFSPDCSDIKIEPNTVEHAYLALLNEDLATAKAVFSKIDNPRGIWGTILISILEGYMEIFPTFFQIRNFLEIDLDLLLKNEKINYVEQLLGALDIFAEINQESYKFVARVMLENNLFSAAFNYMQKSKDIYYNDAELHFMLMRYYLKVHDFEQAYFHVNECLKLIPNYYPALIMKEQIEENYL